MSITAAELLVMVKAEGASNVELSLAAVGAAVVAAGVESVKMAGDFQQSMTQLVTGAGESRSNLKTVSDGILQMSIDTATGTDKLASGMFNVESATYHGAAGLKVLKAAAEGAKAENANLAQTTDVLTTTMHGLHASADQAIPIMNSLIATERDGKMRMDDLTGAMKNVLPVSSSLHIHLADVEGALATMAASGDKGASAGTHLAMMFKMLENPASSAAKEMRAMGIDSVKLAETMSTSLPDALKMIQDAVAQHFTPGSVEYERAIAKILGGSKSGIAGLELLGDNFKNLAKNTNDAAEALRKGGVDVENWDLIQKNFNFQLEAAANAVNVLMIKVGTALLPVLEQLFKNVTPTISAFSQWIDKSGVLAGITQTLSGWVGKLGEAFNYVADAFNQVFQPVQNLTDAFDRNASIIKPTGEAIKSLGEALAPLTDAFDRNTQAVHRTTQEVKNAPNTWIPFWTFVKNVIADVKRIDWGGIGAGLERIRVAISKMDWGKVGAFFSGIVTSISKVDWGKVGKDIEQIAIGFTKVDWGKVGKALSDIVGALLKVDWAKTGKDVQNLLDALSTVDWKATLQGFTDVINGIKDVVQFFSWMEMVLVGHSIIPDTINAIVKWFASLPGKLGNLISTAVNNVIGWFARLPGRLGAIISTVVGNVVGGFQALGSRAIGAVNTFIGQVGSSFSGLISSAFGWGQSFVNNVVSGIQSVAGNINATLHNMHIPGFASGIENFGGGLAYVHAGEVLTYLPPGTSVTPASKVSAMGGSAPVIHNHIDVYLDGSRMTGQLMPRIVQQIRTATGAKI